MDNISGLLPQWLQTDFAGRTKDELRAACRHLEISIAPNEGIETLTRKLLQYYGKFDDQPTGKPVVSPKVAKLRTPPNLRSLKDWGGKRYRIRAMAQDESRGGARAFPVCWEGEAYIIDPKIVPYQDVPAPVYHNLLDAVAGDLKTEWKNEQKQMQYQWINYPRFPIQVLGVTPGTEHLPESLRDWYIQDALDNDLYSKHDRDALERVWRTLTDGSRPNRDDKDRGLGQWRYEVLQLLGLTPEQTLEAA